MGGGEWLALGGVRFALATCRMNFVLAALPPWCSPLYLSLSLLGLIGWPGREAVLLRATAIVYLGFFAFVGRPENFYWGWLLTPSLFMGFVWHPMVLRDSLSKTTKH